MCVCVCMDECPARSGCNGGNIRGEFVCVCVCVCACVCMRVRVREGGRWGVLRGQTATLTPTPTRVGGITFDGPKKLGLPYAQVLCVCVCVCACKCTCNCRCAVCVRKCKCGERGCV